MIKMRRRALAVIAFGCCAAMGGLAILRAAPLPVGDAIDPSRVLADNGQSLGDLIARGITRQEVPLNEIPVFLQEATIAVEDATFYSHNGLNLKGILRAFLANLGAGHVVQGGSTITQQLAKNLYLSGDRTLWRKIREAIYALQLEMHFPKRQILAEYLNVIYYGDGATGVAAASEYYFGKPVRDLDLAESALIAGLPKGPSLYSPYVSLTAAKERQQVVLQAMVKNGILTPSAAFAAYREPLRFAHRRASESPAPYFTDAVAKEAIRDYHLTRDDLYRGGLLLRTTMNPELQRALSAAVSGLIRPHPGLQAAAVVMDPATGDVLAYTGGADYRTGPFDRAQAMRQPGSTFKPFVYAAALDNGYTATLSMKSAPQTFSFDGGRPYRVHNFGDIYTYGLIDMKQAIARSDNVFAVGANLKVGPARVVETAERFGLPTDMKPYPSLALGVFPVSVLQLARAYAVFANGGYLVKPRMIENIAAPGGRILYEGRPQRLMVESPATCYILTDMMESVMKRGGTGYRIAKDVPGLLAAKTGTTDTDAWMVGYTPRTVCAVWVGYDRMRPLNAIESHLPAQVFARAMSAANRERGEGTFTQPAAIKTLWIDPETGQLATSACPLREQDVFASGTEPTIPCAAHPAPDRSAPEKLGGALRSLWHWLTGGRS